MDAKQQLRGELLARRRALPPDVRRAAGPAVLGWLLPYVRTAERIAAFSPLPDEPRITGLLAERPDVLLPVLLEDHDLDWEAEGDRLGKEAIALCDLVLVPALAVDQSGVRLGRGGGSYDRALRRASGLTIAVVHDGEHLAMLPRDPHDVPVRAVVTPSAGVVRLDRPR